MPTSIRRPTLSDVAERAGVGMTTVSRVINGGLQVRPETAARVHSVIQALNFIPSNAARVVRGGRSGTIGLVIPSITDPFFAACAAALERSVRERGYMLIVLMTQNNLMKESTGIAELLRHRVEGIILAPTCPSSPRLRALLENVPVPLVTFGRPILNSEIPYVAANHCMGAYRATKHMIEHGYTHIACLSAEDKTYAIRERLRGYHEAMKAAGMPLCVIHSTGSRAYASAAVRRLLTPRKRPQAILTLTAGTTTDTLAALQEHKVAVPQGVALVGFDDFALAGTLRPSVSVVEQPIQDLGRTAVDILFERLVHSRSPDAPHRQASHSRVKLPTRLICRESCGCALQERREIPSAYGIGMAGSPIENTAGI